MRRNPLIWIGLLVGSTIGGFIPDLWGAGMFSFSGILFSGIGAVAGIFAGFYISQSM